MSNRRIKGKPYSFLNILWLDVTDRIGGYVDKGYCSRYTLERLMSRENVLIKYGMPLVMQFVFYRDLLCMSTF